jgi:hypothetical protein
MNDELKGMGKETVVVQFKILLRYSSGRTEDNQKKTMKIIRVPAENRASTLRIQVRSLTACANFLSHIYPSVRPVVRQYLRLNR